ncbi:MAG TPA: hypothetical protein VF559_02160 [Caulobacteraceae bacterium]|jgi:hypothetical protein
MGALLPLAALVLISCATEQPAAPPPPEAPSETGMCRTAEFQWLVGRRRGEIPPLLPQPARVTCTSCAVTMDHNPGRLNIFYDEATGVVREVRCG